MTISRRSLLWGAAGIPLGASILPAAPPAVPLVPPVPGELPSIYPDAPDNVTLRIGMGWFDPYFELWRGDKFYYRFLDEPICVQIVEDRSPRFVIKVRDKEGERLALMLCDPERDADFLVDLTRRLTPFVPLKTSRREADDQLMPKVDFASAYITITGPRQ